jgi:hypothetical protein
MCSFTRHFCSLCKMLYLNTHQVSQYFNTPFVLDISGRYIVTMRNQLHCISYFDVQPSTSGLTIYLLISITDLFFMTPLGLQKHTIAIVKGMLQQFITIIVLFRVAYGGDGVEIRTMAVSTIADRR